ncbi:phytoene/squalene synthase family protein [Lysobacter yangpyeongensis]|uniref:Phytoene/squalene synthase family protein n=1 Tax=Lysobacter yangpyeongensis TaxID=346182 RepID=A0ABW0SL25_9GAMM
MSDRDAVGEFLDKWRARWPEWGVAEVFVPRGQREPVLAWMTLVQELTDAAWGGSDPRPGEAKLGWWIEELQGWARGIRRHPLGAVLQKFPVPWTQVAAALPSLRDSRERPVDAGDALAQMRSFSEAVAAIETGLFGGDEAGAPAVIAVNLLQLRIAHHPAEAAPLQVLAQAGEGGALAEWVRQLARQATVDAGSRPRRVFAGLSRARLLRGTPADPVPAIAALWAAWRAARG